MGESTEGEDQVVMEVVGLVAFARNAVDIDRNEGSRQRVAEGGRGLFDDFAMSRKMDGGVGRFNMAAREEPAIQPAVMNQEDPGAGGVGDKAGASDVARRELVPREGRGRGFEEEQDEFGGFAGGAVGGIGESADKVGYSRRIDHKSRKARS